MNGEPHPLISLPTLPDPPPEEYPRIFGNYVLLSPLARGGMGEVFLAKHGSVAGMEKHCVVKTLRPHLTDDREYTTRFVDEARIVVQLGHRNICHVFDVGTVGERFYLAMEHIAGKDLRALASDVSDPLSAHGGGVMNPGLALHIVSEILEALDYAHRHVDAASGQPMLLVHRDVSPQNVMLSWEGEVKLIDFGLAASTLKMEQTSPNVVMGKLAYMAPEQVRGERVDGRADQFAVAMVLYELLMGERFYEGRNPYEIWGLAAAGGFRPRGWHGLDPDVQAILERALSTEVSARFATCLGLREALQTYRYARELRGDAPMLRALMQQVYAPEIDESRRVLVKLSNARVPARQDTASAPPHEATVSLARSISRSISNERALAPVNERTGPTEMVIDVHRGDRRRRGSLIAAGVALLAVAAGVAVASDLLRGRPAVVLAEARPTQLEVLAERAAPPEPAAEPAIGAPEEARPLVEPVAEPDVVAKPKPRRRKVRTSAVVAQEPRATEDTPVVKDAERPTWRALSDPKRVDALGRLCGAQPCTREVAKHRNDFGSLHAEPLRDWKAAIHACWRRCKLPE